MLKIATSLVLILCLATAPAVAQSDAETDAVIDNVLGDHTLYREAFDAIQQAVADDDRAAYAAWVGYPIKVVADGEEMTIDEPAQFIEKYDNILTDEIRGAITSQHWQDLFANDQGVMFGNGQVWLNGICKDDTCEQFEVKIVAIQSTAS